ncbi:probable microtubule-binding protein TANGLED [Vicia villosa]|uniref:probable microtubule-binding protein TANGLED n=1 Tax=Vicia villosa TaxID=3911 RepID=UPI00273BFF74|nr:probable microtubule-binding protein TANGLED [Vicia villosa]
MVSKTPLTQNNNMLPVFNPVLIRETLNKVDRCMNRLQELQFTVSGLNLSPRSARNYLRTSLRCKQESIRIKNNAQKTSPVGKFSKSDNLGGEWRQMSLPAMLVGETVVEILQASQFAREMVSSVGPKPDPKTPISRSSHHKSDPENTQLRAKRSKEKENKQQFDSPPLQPHRVRSRINFEVVAPPKKARDFDKEKENIKHLANRVSPRNRPWSKKTVLFPNPLFSSTSSHQREFCKTKSPVMSTTPHKFRIKSPYKFMIESPNRVTKTSPKFRIKSPHVFVDESRNRVTKTQHKFRKESEEHKFLIKSPSRAKTTTPHKFRIESPHKFHIKTPPSPKRATRLNYPKRFGAASTSSRTISPSRLAAPTKSKKSVQKSNASVCLSKSSPTSEKSDGLSKSSPKRSAASKLRRSFSPSRLVTKALIFERDKTLTCVFDSEKVIIKK